MVAGGDAHWLISWVKTATWNLPPGATDAPATGSITRKADGTECAHVLCFDWSQGCWVPETIEIPAIDTSTTELSEGLKVLIGAGAGMGGESRTKQPQPSSQR